MNNDKIAKENKELKNLLKELLEFLLKSLEE